MEPKRILIMRTDRIGDVILSTPAIQGIKQRLPQSHIAIIVTPKTRDIVEGNPFIDEVIIYDKKSRHKSIMSTLKFALMLKKKNFDTVIVLHPTNRAHLIAFLSGAKTRIGYNRNFSFLLTNKVSHLKQEGKKHEVEYVMDLVRNLDPQIKRGELFMPLQAEAQAYIDNILNNYRIQNNNIFILHPGASCASKKWPVSNYLKLAQMITEKYHGTVVFIGDERVKKDLSEYNNLFDKNIITLAGELNLKQTLALLNKGVILISNDSGPVHMAACVKTPCISIFGRKNPGLSPVRWGPAGKNDKYIHKDVGCGICTAHNCEKDFLCIKSITPEEVMIKVEEITETSAKPPPEGKGRLDPASKSQDDALDD